MCLRGPSITLGGTSLRHNVFADSRHDPTVDIEFDSMVDEVSLGVVMLLL
jgi:hypothetical protein